MMDTQSLWYHNISGDNINSVLSSDRQDNPFTFTKNIYSLISAIKKINEQ